MRDQTERPEGIEAGTLALVGADRGRIVNAGAYPSRGRWRLRSDGAREQSVRRRPSGPANRRVAAGAAARRDDAGGVSAERQHRRPRRLNEPPGWTEEVSQASGPNVRDAVADQGLRAYRAARRSMVLGSLIAAVPLGLLTLIGSRIAALALVVGVLCGILNALVSMRSNERLIDHRSALIFVLSSVLRVFVFGILPVGFVLHGPVAGPRDLLRWVLHPPCAVRESARAPRMN